MGDSIGFVFWATLARLEPASVEVTFDEYSCSEIRGESVSNRTALRGEVLGQHLSGR